MAGLLAWLPLWRSKKFRLRFFFYVGGQSKKRKKEGKMMDCLNFSSMVAGYGFVVLSGFFLTVLFSAAPTCCSPVVATRT